MPPLWTIRPCFYFQYQYLHLEDCSLLLSVGSVYVLKSLYSVMQSDGNSHSGDVILDSINMVYRDEDSISGPQEPIQRHAISGNSHSGDVILDSISMVYRDEDSISNQIYEKQLV